MAVELTFRKATSTKKDDKNDEQNEQHSATDAHDNDDRRQRRTITRLWTTRTATSWLQDLHTANNCQQTYVILSVTFAINF